MPKTSAGIALFRRRGAALEVFLVHPGGPFWRRKDAGAWTVPKGAVEEGEDRLSAARREFEEETGMRPVGNCLPLGDYRQSAGKIVTVFALEGDIDPAALSSNSFTMEWPPRSGRIASFPEVDRGGWFSLEEAAAKLVKGQVPMLAALRRAVGQ